MLHKQYKDYAKYILDKNNGDMKLAKKIISNSAIISHSEGDLESFNRETEVFQHLEVLSSN